MRIGSVLALGLAAVMGLSGPAEANAEAEPQLAWSWDAPHRFYVETEVLLPQTMWFVSEFNKQTRVVAFQVRAVLDCAAGEAERRRVREVLCDVEDISLTAASWTEKEKQLPDILEELDERLSDASVQMQIRDDGRIVNIDLEGLDRRNQRVGDMNENLRIVMSRTVAGLDLQLPKSGELTDEAWPQYQNLLMQAPSAIGTSGASEIVHKVRERRKDGTLLIESAGRGMIVPAGSGNNYDTNMAAFGTFDPERGILLERSWTTIGDPTASSAIAEVNAGLQYVQRGRLKLLGPGEEVDVGESREVAAPGRKPSTLQVWPPFGTTPAPMSR